MTRTRKFRFQTIASADCLDVRRLWAAVFEKSRSLAALGTTGTSSNSLAALGTMGAFCAFLVFANTARLSAQATPPVRNDAAVYRDIQRLGALGLIDTLLLGIRPYSEHAIVRLLTQAQTS